MVETLLIGPRVEPLHLDEAKKHLRVTTASDDDLIKRCIRSARRHAETYTRRGFVRQQRQASLDCFPAAIELPSGPLRAVQSIQYLDPAGALQTVAPADYRVDKLSPRGRITPDFGKVWPPTFYVMNAVTIKYTVGHMAYISSVDLALDTVTSKGHDLAADDPVAIYSSGGGAPGGIDTGDTFYVKAPAADTLQFAAAAGGGAIDIISSGTGSNFIGLLPDDIINGMLLIVHDLYQRRGEASDMPVFTIPRAAEQLLSPYRLVRF